MGRPERGYPEGYLGVSTVSGAIGDKGALAPAAVNLTVEGVERGLRGAELKSYYRNEWSVKAISGTLAHEMIDAWTRGNDPDSAVDEFRKWQGIDASRHKEIKDLARRGYESFHSWFAMSNVVIEPFEEPLLDPKLKIGGTPDAIGKHSGLLTVVDYKSGRFYADTHVPQLAGYKYLLEEVRGMKIDGAHIVKVNKDWDAFDHHYFPAAQLEVGWAAFRAALDMLRARKVLKGMG